VLSRRADADLRHCSDQQYACDLQWATSDGKLADSFEEFFADRDNTPKKLP